MKRLHAILLGMALVVGAVGGLLWGHEDAKAQFDDSGDLTTSDLDGGFDDLYAAKKRRIGTCPGGGTPKCVACYGGKCDWACRGGYYCGAGPGCSVVGVSCGGSSSIWYW